MLLIIVSLINSAKLTNYVNLENVYLKIKDAEPVLLIKNVFMENVFQAIHALMLNVNHMNFVYKENVKTIVLE
jgi:hypothetical protein